MTSSPWNREDVISLGQQPRKGRLAHCHAFRGGNFLEGFDQLHVLGEVLSGVSRVKSANIALFEVVGSLNAAAQQATRQRGVSDDGHAKLAASSEELVLWGLNLSAECAIFHLDACNGVNGMSAPKCCG